MISQAPVCVRVLWIFGAYHSVILRVSQCSRVASRLRRDWSSNLEQ